MVKILASVGQTAVGFSKFEPAHSARNGSAATSFLRGESYDKKLCASCSRRRNRNPAHCIPQLNGHPAPDHCGWLAQEVAFKIGQGLFALRASSLLFVKEDGQGTEQGEILSSPRFFDLATVFILGAVAAVVLAI